MASLLREQSSTRLAKVSRQKNEQEQVISKVKEKRGKFQMTPNQLKKISLDENGTFMSDFDPERSKREMRKLNRKIHKENKKLNQMYDETGRLLENSLDICDCLDKDCPGCHFPCPKCASEKCGAECRSGRRWTYEQVEVEGTNLVFKWSSTTAS
ncbi:hypothetical protein C0Q70_19925 [Pomacea canaliculata]|uniref:ARF7 effector protein C-terminal domain-containing protein n=1 Tax=Pomacea canaliculata TaxID=400727 RepID=A0A2T7NE43_POMCA|nr:hypothetical protein C0Q70_19925 [Pomacea canaliculata]